MNYQNLEPNLALFTGELTVSIYHYGEEQIPVVLKVVNNLSPQPGQCSVRSRPFALSPDPKKNNSTAVSLYRGWPLVGPGGVVVVPEYYSRGLGRQIELYPQFVQHHLGEHFRFRYDPKKNWNQYLINSFKPTEKFRRDAKPYAPVKAWLGNEAQEVFEQFNTKDGFCRWMVENGFANLMPPTDIVPRRDLAKFLEQKLKEPEYSHGAVIQHANKSGGVGTFLIKRKQNGGYAVFPSRIQGTTSYETKEFRTLGEALEKQIRNHKGNFVVRPFVGSFEGETPVANPSFSVSFYLDRHGNDISVYFMPTRDLVCGQVFKYRGFCANDEYLELLFGNQDFLRFILTIAEKFAKIPFPFIYSIDLVVDNNGNPVILEVNLRDSGTSAPFAFIIRLSSLLGEEFEPLLNPFNPKRRYSIAQYDFVRVDGQLEEIVDVESIDRLTDKFNQRLERRIKKSVGVNYDVVTLDLSMLIEDLAEQRFNRVYTFPLTPFYFPDGEKGFANVLILFPNELREVMLEILRGYANQNIKNSG